jgi:dihydrofolate reductase
MIGIIAAVSSNGVIGVDNHLPFNYPEDLKHFKKMTRNSVVIMGRKTFESIGKPLLNRENVIISSKQLSIPNTKCFNSIKNALDQYLNKNIWFIGGASIYQEGLLYADEIHLTVTPDYIDHPNSVKFPWINPTIFQVYDYNIISDSKKLIHVCYMKGETLKFLPKLTVKARKQLKIADKVRDNIAEKANDIILR